MRSEKFHAEGEIAAPIVVDEATRLTIQGTKPVHVFQVDDNGKKVKLLHSGINSKIKLHNVNEIILESEGDFNSIIEGPEQLDNTPIEVPVEKPLTQTQQLKMWLQNEDNMKSYARHELTWEEFKDLGDLDDSDEFYERFGQPGMTKYEMQAEAMRQELNPLRGNPISENIKESNNVESGNDSGIEGDTTTVPPGTGGQMDDKGQQETTRPDG
jgi:hypothetical protein